MSKSQKRFLITIAGVTSVLLIGFLSGPRVPIDSELHPLQLPNDLDQYLADSEAPFTDITPGTEKTIIWAEKTKSQTPLSVVYLHGFSATRQEIAPLPEKVAQALGANLYYTRFTGHGRSGKAMLEGSVNAWLNDAHEALAIGRRLGEKVVVIGTSTGGTLATWLATQASSESVAAFILISPNFALSDSRSKILLWPWGAQIATLIAGSEHHWAPLNKQHAMYWTHRYPTPALLPMMGLVKLAKSFDYESIKQPLLIIFSPNDQVIDTKAIETIYPQIGSLRKQLLPYTGSSHVTQHLLAGDILSPESTDELATFINNFITQ